MFRALYWVLPLVVACGSSHDTIDGPAGGDGPGPQDGPGHDGTHAARTVFVIPMENEPSSAIYGNTNQAPYINGLFAAAARATMFHDELPSLASEPHYLWMEAGTNSFADKTFLTDDNPSASNSTTSTAHLVTQLTTAGLSWMAYQEDIAADTCPIGGVGQYAPKHDPFVFFTDVAGNPPSASNAGCKAHHKPYSRFAADLAAGTLASYVFITPNLCNDMHGSFGCPGNNSDIKSGDNWLAAQLPPILSYAQAHDSVVFLVWDEGDSSNLVPFLALGPHVKVGTTSSVSYSHSSMVKSVEEMLGVPVLPSVASANDLADLFQAGHFP